MFLDPPFSAPCVDVMRPKFVFETPPDDIWEIALGSLGINPASLFVGRGVN